VADSYEHGNETPVSIKWGKILTRRRTVSFSK